MKLEGQLDRIEKKVDVHTEVLAEIKADLRYHIKRTDLLEHKVGLVSTAVAVSRFVLWAGAIAGAAMGVLKLWQSL